MRIIPAVKRVGKTMISQTDTPSAPCLADMPSRPISVAVSKRRPNRAPSGHTCQHTCQKTFVGQHVFEILLMESTTVAQDAKHATDRDQNHDVGSCNGKQEQRR